MKWNQVDTPFLPRHLWLNLLNPNPSVFLWGFRREEEAERSVDF
jgi:hypothetical protein